MMAMSGTVKTVSFSAHRRYTMRVDSPLQPELLSRVGWHCSHQSNASGRRRSTCAYVISPSFASWRTEIHCPPLVAAVCTALKSLNARPRGHSTLMDQPALEFQHAV